MKNHKAREIKRYNSFASWHGHYTQPSTSRLSQCNMNEIMALVIIFGAIFYAAGIYVGRNWDKYTTE